MSQPPKVLQLGAILLMIGAVWLITSHAEAQNPVPAPTGTLWVHDNLFASTVLHSADAKQPFEEKAQLLEKLGFKQCGCVWWDTDLPTFDVRIESLKHHGIRMLSWPLLDVDDLQARVDWKDTVLVDPSTLMGSGNPERKALTVQQLLETFKRHDVHPQLWLAEFRQLDVPRPAAKISSDELDQFWKQRMREDLPKTPREQKLRVRQEADRIAALVRLADPYGVKVEIYKHGGWFGVMDNAIAVIKRLETLGVSDVGIVYPFIHARDEPHDDLMDFPALWERIKPYVVAVNITGMHTDGTILNPHRESDKVIIFPSQGTRELEMMRTIQASGWRGPLGLSDEKGGDSEIDFRNNLTGFDWLVGELIQSGSGGPRPFTLMP